jgi:hypothetical protein
MKWLNTIFNKKEKKENSEIAPERLENGWDEVYDATFSGDLKKMLSVTELKTKPINRHYLLQTIISETYKLRKEEKYRTICIEHSEKHLEEFPEIVVELKKDDSENLPRVSTFQNYATLLTELGEYEKAISICKIAISYGLNDGTKSNYQGRIDRISKKMLNGK